jgi:epoxyqueuosine reductase QueG
MTDSHEIREPADWVDGIIRRFLNDPSKNTLKNSENDWAWDDPLIGFSNGTDPLWEEFKNDIGSFYWTPKEVFSKRFPHSARQANELTVVSWVLPQTNKTKSAHRKETIFPAESWARARIYGEEVNTALHEHIVARLTAAGYEAVAPTLSALWERMTSDRYGFASTWSHRHAAYVSGLGTFGLCDGLITPRGKAMRCGSIIAAIHIPPTHRPYTHHQEYCLFFSKGLCGQCIERCPAGAISQSGHDKDKCRQYLRTVTTEYVRSTFGFEGYGCGFCQTNVPCESQIPTESDLLESQRTNVTT